LYYFFFSLILIDPHWAGYWAPVAARLWKEC